MRPGKIAVVVARICCSSLAPVVRKTAVGLQPVRILMASPWPCTVAVVVVARIVVVGLRSQMRLAGRRKPAGAAAVAHRNFAVAAVALHIQPELLHIHRHLGLHHNLVARRLHEAEGNRLTGLGQCKIQPGCFRTCCLAQCIG